MPALQVWVPDPPVTLRVDGIREEQMDPTSDERGADSSLSLYSERQNCLLAFPCAASTSASSAGVNGSSHQSRPNSRNTWARVRMGRQSTGVPRSVILGMPHAVTNAYSKYFSIASMSTSCDTARYSGPVVEKSATIRSCRLPIR